jgi:hypothetical protein
MNKKLIRLTESDLHRIVKESVEKIISEVLNDPVAHEDAYALAGAAKGATKTLGGKLKGMFNPAWKARKERQYNAFADRGEELRDRLKTINKGNPNFNYSEEVDNDIAARNNGYKNPGRAAKQYGF